VNLLGGPYLRPNHNTGVIVATMCGNRHIWRGSCNRTELRRERSCGPNTPTRSSPIRDEHSSTCRPNDQFGPPVVHFRRKIVIARVQRLALAIGNERLISADLALRKSSETSSAIHGPGMGTVHVDHQKDVAGFGQRLGRQASRKIDPPRPRPPPRSVCEGPSPGSSRAQPA
jgi:hypothetical protein